MRVIIQAGHSSEFPPFRAAGGGAPGEAVWTADLARRIRQRLMAAGVDVDIVGSWLSAQAEYSPPQEMKRDAALFVALHYDADIYPDRTGCFADRWEFDTPTIAARSARALAAWEVVYPNATQIPLRNTRRNVNTSRYYGYRAKTVNTPGLLIEHGVGQGLDKPMLFTGIDIVADADASAILQYLGLPAGADDVTPEQQSILDSAARQTEAGNTIANGGDLDWWIGTWKQLASDKESLSQLLAKAQQERDGYMARVAELEAQAPSAAVDVARVTVALTDGREVVR